MCFSAVASFVAAGVTGGIGVVSLARVKEPRELPLAAAPIIFSSGSHRLQLNIGMETPARIEAA